MASSFTKLTYHVVFSTKYRRRTLHSPLREELYRVIGGIVRNHDGNLLAIGGVEDHVHLLLGIPAKMSVADMLQHVKGSSSKWVNDRESLRFKFQWQPGYAAFTVSHSQRSGVRKYIQNQPEHHQTISFQAEFLEFLKRHEIAYDPHYVFEEEHAG